MRHRFFVRHLSADAVVALEGDERHHAHVLRIREGEEIELFDGRGNNWIARWESADAIPVLRPGENREWPAAVLLAMSIIQLDKFELVLQKATELGVRAFIPLIADRIEVRPERFRGKAERWRKIIFEAVKQSGRSLIPTLENPASFDEVIAREGSKIVFDPDAPPTTGNRQPVTILIGPEGGWSERELELAREHGAAFQRIGPRRLRAETAALAAVALFANS